MQGQQPVPASNATQTNQPMFITQELNQQLHTLATQQREAEVQFSYVQTRERQQVALDRFAQSLKTVRCQWNGTAYNKTGCCKEDSIEGDVYCKKHLNALNKAYYKGGEVPNGFEPRGIVKKKKQQYISNFEQLQKRLQKPEVIQKLKDDLRKSQFQIALHIRGLPTPLPVCEEKCTHVDTFKCIICQESKMPEGSILAGLPCLHFFHSKCIEPWANNSNSCPVCRAKFTTIFEYATGKKWKTVEDRALAPPTAGDRQVAQDLQNQMDTSA